MTKGQYYLDPEGGGQVVMMRLGLKRCGCTREWNIEITTNGESNIPIECASITEGRNQLFVTVFSLYTKILSLKKHVKHFRQSCNDYSY